MIEKLEKIKTEALKDISECNDEVSLNNVKSKYIGKKSVFNEIMAGMSSLSNEEQIDQTILAISTFLKQP